MEASTEGEPLSCGVQPGSALQTPPQAPSAGGHLAVTKQSQGLDPDFHAIV